MTQQNTRINENTQFKRKLFYDNGIRFVEVKATQLIEYKPPTPIVKSKVNPVIYGTSGLLSQGTSHYTASLQLLFYSKKDYADWLQYVGMRHKYYDEKGSIYYGIYNGQPDVQMMDGNTKYMVSCSFFFIKKQEKNSDYVPYTDINGHWANQYISELSNRNLLSAFSNDNNTNYILPDKDILRNELTGLTVSVYKYIEGVIRG